jgi:ATP-dependent exoDNAse (exonuclease V) beta subunit
VHATLATVPPDAAEETVRRIAETQGRILLGLGEGAGEETYAAVEVVLAVLRHPIFDAVRRADAAGRCQRELPIIWEAPDGALVEGTIDLAFDDGETLTAVDFKTDRELEADMDRYRRQLAIYCRALGALKGRPTRGILMRV